MSGPDLPALREAGRIAAAVRDAAAARMVPGARVRDVCEWADTEIGRRGGGAAFPTQSSRNEIAAHYCPSPTDETAYAAGDLAKLDLGVHVDGWVVDTALTVHVGAGKGAEGPPLIAAAEAALEAALATVGPGVEVRRVSAAIENTLHACGVRPLRNLCGHGVGRWTVHGPPPVPNMVMSGGAVLTAGTVIAIEPFSTLGPGLVHEEGAAEVFRLAPGTPTPGLDPTLRAALEAFRGLPFARRQLSDFDPQVLASTLGALRAAGRLAAYPPLLESGRFPVAQAEHTVYVGPDGPEVLTR